MDIYFWKPIICLMMVLYMIDSLWLKQLPFRVETQYSDRPTTVGIGHEARRGSHPLIADPSRCNSTNRQNLLDQQNSCNFRPKMLRFRFLLWVRMQYSLLYGYGFGWKPCLLPWRCHSVLKSAEEKGDSLTELITSVCRAIPGPWPGSANYVTTFPTISSTR